MRPIDVLAAEILRRHDEDLMSGGYRTRPAVPRASSIGDCDREIVHSIVDWQMQPVPAPFLQAIFATGNETEEIILRRLSKYGMPVKHTQMTAEIRDRDNLLLATAHVDGRMEWQNLTPVVEIKTINQWTWAQLQNATDWNSLTPWSRKYPRQLILYMYALSEPWGLWIVDDKSRHWKVIPISLEDCLEECETLLRRLRAIAGHLAAGTFPPHLDDPAACQKCWAFKVGACSPPMDFTSAGYHVIENAELDGMLCLLKARREARDEFENAQKLVHEHFKARGEGRFIVGSHVVIVTKNKAGACRVNWDPDPEQVTA
jgi:hypothetical protein